MRKWKQKWIKGTRGAISLLLALLLDAAENLAPVLHGPCLPFYCCIYQQLYFTIIS